MLFPKIIEDFEYDCVIDKSFKKIKLGELTTKFTVIIFYPLDFTFVCPTEIQKFSDLNKIFKELDVSIIFASCDSKYSHLAWINTPREQNGLGDVHWPMISDITHKLSSQFNLFNEETGTVMRSTVILGQNLNVLHMSVNIDPIGRSSHEVIRLVKALQSFEQSGEVCYVDHE